MFKLLKWVVGLFSVLLVLVIGSAAVAIITINPNDFKPQITAQVKKATGRELKLSGDINWSFYPWLGLNLGNTSLANAAGFGSEPLVEIDEVDIKVKLLPLLKKSLHAKQILIRGASLNLQKNAQGVDNWSDLAKTGTPAEPSPAERPGSKPDLEIQINGLKITDAKLRYRDQQAGSDIRINPFNLSTGAIKIGKPIELITDFVFTQDGIRVAADLSSTVIADPDNGSYELKNLKLTQTTQGDGLPEDGITSTQKLSLHANIKTQKLMIDPLSIELAGLALEGRLNVDQFIDHPNYSGQFSSNAFNPKELLTSLDIALPETSNKNAFNQASLAFDLDGTKTKLNLRALQATLDDSTLSGEFSLTDFATQAMRFNLNLDQLNVDDYMSPPRTPNTSATDSEIPVTSSDEITLPLALLRKLDIDGTAKIGKLQAQKLQFEDATVTLKAKNGEILIAPLTAKAYDGSAVISASLNAVSATPAYRLKVDLSGVRSEHILETLFGERYLSGAAGFKADITTSANTVSALQENLNGSFKAEFSDGTIQGSELSKKINEARNFWRKLAGKPAVTNDSAKNTEFSSLKASGNIRNGIVTNQDLTIVAPIFQAKGDGKVDLPGKTINYTLSLADDGAAGTTRTFLPLQIKGSFDDLSFRLRVDSVLKDRAKLELDAKKAELKAKVDAEKFKLKARLEEEKAEKKAALKAKAEAKKAEIKEKVEEKKQDLEKKLKDELKDKLKGIF